MTKFFYCLKTVLNFFCELVNILIAQKGFISPPYCTLYSIGTLGKIWDYRYRYDLKSQHSGNSRQILTSGKYRRSLKFGRYRFRWISTREVTCLDVQKMSFVELQCFSYRYLPILCKKSLIISRFSWIKQILSLGVENVSIQQETLFSQICRCYIFHLETYLRHNLVTNWT